MKYIGSILVVEDNEMVRDPLKLLLEIQGHTVTEASNGYEALEKVAHGSFDLILLDIMMPKMDGYEVLSRLSEHEEWRNLPVIVLSAVDSMDSVVRCIQLGAEDYLVKPFNKVLLRARVESSLEKKWRRDQAKQYLQEIEAEREKSEQLLLNILPKAITERLKGGVNVIADSFEQVTVLFADIVNFTHHASDLEPEALVEVLNTIFSLFDSLADEHGLEKIKTIGDAYMVVSGVPTTRPDHAEAMAEMALAMQEAVHDVGWLYEFPLQMRIGMSSGPVVAGVIGKNKFAYDLWGDTVNTASRMESNGLTGKIQVSQSTYEILHDKYLFEARGLIDVKGKGELPAYILKEKRSVEHG